MQLLETMNESRSPLKGLFFLRHPLHRGFLWRGLPKVWGCETAAHILTREQQWFPIGLWVSHGGREVRHLHKAPQVRVVRQLGVRKHFFDCAHTVPSQIWEGFEERKRRFKQTSKNARQPAGVGG